jgi:Large polyvalent protein associated domain 29
MATKHFTCAETAKLVRQALKEAFPGMKFSVRSHTYSGGASINISWIDGPNSVQVEAVADTFKAAYFDGSIDYQGSIYHMVDGQQVHFGADFIFCRREHSDEAIQAAIDRVYRRLEGNFKQDGIEKPTVEAFRRGQLWSVQLSGYHVCGGVSVQTEICGAVSKHTYRPKTETSTTAGKVFVTHDDGYSRTNGAGFSAVSIE